MPFQIGDHLPLNRGGTAGDGATGDYHVDTVSELFELARTYFLTPIWAEESAALIAGTGNNAREWSFGNGDTGTIGIVLPIQYELVHLTFEADTFGTSVSINPQVNDGDTQDITFTAARQTQALAAPINIPAGATLGFRTSGEVGAASSARVCAWLAPVIA